MRKAKFKGDKLCEWNATPEAAAAEMRKIVEDVANRRKAEAPPPTTPAPTPDDADDGSEEDEP